MSELPHVRVDPNASADDIDAVVAGLLAFNVARIGDPNEEPVQIFVRDSHGTILGGLLGDIKWRWMFVSKLWVSDDLRGAGYGSELMVAAEELARSRTCIGIYLSTFEFQARPFYEKLGYTVFGTLDGYPPGFCQHYLVKLLSPAEDSTQVR
jgi:GNAT superfamily N-acetyltransferase